MPWENNDLGGLNKLDQVSGTFTRYLHEPDNPRSLISIKVRAILEVENGNFWVGTQGNGLHKMDRTNGTFERIPNESMRSGTRSGLSIPLPSNPAAHITRIVEDADGALWIGTFTDGLIRYEPGTSQTTLYYGGDQFRDHSAWWIDTSNEGLVWVSTQELNFFQIDVWGEEIAAIPVPESGEVNSIVEYENGKLWLGTSTGLVRFDLATQTNTPVKIGDLSEDIALFNLLLDSNGIIWATDNTGLIRYDPEAQSTRRFVHDPNDSTSLFNNIVFDIYESTDHQLWIGTVSGLNSMDLDNFQMRRYQNVVDSIPGAVRSSIAGIFEDSYSNLWLSMGPNGGLTRKTPSGRFKQYLPTSTVRSFVPTPD
jgi:ligand-binding sensor domain-containing protein